MQRPQLEHIIRAAAGITGAKEFVIIGSQAVLGQFPNTPDELLVSIEADLFSLRNPADADLIDGSIGEVRRFIKHSVITLMASRKKPLCCLRAGKNGSFQFKTKIPAAEKACVWKSTIWPFPNLQLAARKIWILSELCCVIISPNLKLFETE